MKSGETMRRRGFTLIELLVSMAVMTVGTAALFALQGYVAHSNMHSKEMTFATTIAENWVERLKLDALNWTQPGDPGAPGINLGNTAYLQDINAGEDTWRAPLLGNSAVLGHSPGADLLGNEIAAWGQTGNVTVGYCTNLRFNWITAGSVMRVDVRVFWPRRPSNAVIMTDFPQCDNADRLFDVNGDGADDYRAVFTSTAIRWTP